MTVINHSISFMAKAQVRAKSENKTASVSTPDNQSRELNSLLVDNYYRLLVKKSNVCFKGNNKDTYAQELDIQKDKALQELSKKVELANVAEPIKQGLPQFVEKIFERIAEAEEILKKGENPDVSIFSEQYVLNQYPKIKALYDFIEGKNADNPCIAVISDASLNDYLTNKGTKLADMSLSDRKELLKSRILFLTRENLSGLSTQYLNHYKDTDELKPLKKEIDEIVKIINKRIRIIGLNPEVQEIVKKADEELNVKLEIHNSEKFARFIYDYLSFYKNNPELGVPLPDYVISNNVQPFSIITSQAYAMYVPIYSNDKDPNLEKYGKNNDLLGKKFLYYDPYYIIKDINNDIYDNICELTHHEIRGHQRHHSNIGDERFKEYGRNSNIAFIKAILTPEEQEILNTFRIKHLNENPESLNEQFKDFDFIVRMYDRFKKSLGAELSDDLVKKLDPVIEKLRKEVYEPTEQSVLPEQLDYALTKPTELVAVAAQSDNKITPTPEFQKLLRKFGAPEPKDRSMLPEDHPVIRNIKAQKPKN